MNAQQLFDDAFSKSRDPRSDEYKQGMLEALEYHLGESHEMRRRYNVGTVQADAWFAGTDEGRRRARELVRNREALLSAIESAEKELRDKMRVLLDLQHQYLESAGFTIEPIHSGFGIDDYTYSRDDETFIDADLAMEYAEAI